MFHTRSARLAAVAVALLVAVPLAGCGSTTKTASKNTSASASPTAAGASDPSATLGTEVDKNAFIATVTNAMRARKTARMTLQLGSSMTAQAQVRYTATGSEMNMEMSTGAQKVSLILVNGAMYLRQGASAKYVKIDKSDPAMGNLLSQMSNLGPAGSLNALKSGIQRIASNGTTTVGGVQVTKYLVTVDTAAAAAALGAGATPPTTVGKTVTYTMYVDSDNLLRGIDLQLAGQPVKMVVTNWGDPVDITAPPASQIQKK